MVTFDEFESPVPVAPATKCDSKSVMAANHHLRSVADRPAVGSSNRMQQGRDRRQRASSIRFAVPRSKVLYLLSITDCNSKRWTVVARASSAFAFDQACPRAVRPLIEASINTSRTLRDGYD